MQLKHWLWHLLSRISFWYSEAQEECRQRHLPYRWLGLERLEERIQPSTIYWGNSSGGAWNVPGNWQGGVVPGAGDAAVLNIPVSGTITITDAESVNSLTDTTASLSIASGGTLSLAAVAATSIFGQNVTVQSGGALSVGAGASVQIGIGTFDTTVTLADDGTLTFASGDTVTFDDNTNQSQSAQIVVGSGGNGGSGLMNASDTVFQSLQGYLTQIVVNAGGELQANDSTFSISQVDLADSSVLNSGDLTNNTFNTTLYTPILDVPLLTDNQSFEDVEINPGDSLGSGQSVPLTLMGTVETKHLLYILPGNFTINQGATLAVAPNVPMQIGIGTFDTTVTLADDGTLTFASGDTVTFDDNTNQSQSAQIVVGSGGNGGSGLMNASDTVFQSLQGYLTQIVVNAGGELQANDSTFSISQVDLADSSVLNSGDLTNNTFNTTLYTPILDVPLLTDNQSFEDVEINPGDSLGSGQSVPLTLMGTVETKHLLYILPGNFTINQGATLAVAPNVPMQIGIGTFDTTVTLADDGTLTFASGDTVTFDDNTNQSQSAQIVVGSGGNGGSGLMNASDTVFQSLQGYLTQIVVNAGGELQANDSTFSISQVDLADSSVLNSGDLTNNTFNTTLYTPILDVPLLTDNQSFEDVEINPGDSLGSGQSVPLTLMGTVETKHLLYILPGNFTINQGATLAVAPNVPMQIGIGTFDTTVTLADDGTLTFASGDTVTFDDNTNQSQSAQIVVGSGGNGGSGLMNASDTVFQSLQGYLTQIVVNAGGELQANDSTFALSQLTLANASTDTLGADIISGVFAINSGATLNITGNDFSNVGTNGIVASGDPNATIDLPYNYWGTTVSTQIAAKIYDYEKNRSLPIVTYQPYDTAEPAQTIAQSVSTSFNSASQNVALSATVTSPLGAVNVGTETFTILNGTTVVGTSVKVNVSTGAASAVYALPAGLAGGTYSIEATYNGTNNFLDYTDTSQSLVVSAAASATAAASASATFSSGGQNVTFNATITSAAGTVNAGTETFTILNGTTVVGTPVTVNVSAGAASAVYLLPGGTPAGSYTIQAVYNGTTNFLGFTDSSHSLVVNPATTSGPTDVTSQVTITRGGCTLNHSTGLFVQSITITNTSGTAISGPLTLVLTSLSSNATLANANGTTTVFAPGSPYVSTNISTLDPGDSITLVLQFRDPTRQAINYDPLLLSGSGTV